MEELGIILGDVAVVAVGLVLLLLAKVSLDLLTPFRVDDQMTSKDNPAFGVSLVGYYLGVLIVYAGAIFGEASEESLWFELLVDAGWACLGVLLLNVARVLLDRFVLSSFSTRKEIIEDRNVGMGVIEFGTYVGSALVIAGAVSGEGGGIDTALGFYALGQVALILLALVYEKLTPYSFRGEIERDNVAAGVAYSGNTIAMGVLLLRGLAGDFDGWFVALQDFAYYLCAAFALVVIGRFLIDLVLLPGRTLSEEIVEDRNLNAGLLEGGLLLGFSGLMFFAV